MKKTLFAALALILMATLLSACELDQIVTIDTPVPGTPGVDLTPNPPVPTVVPGAPGSGGAIELPGARVNIYAPGPNPMMNTRGSTGVAGILLGLWHGIISPLTLILSFFNHGVQMYEVHNDGSFYNLGFFLGIAIIIGGLGFLRR